MVVRYYKLAELIQQLKSVLALALNPINLTDVNDKRSKT
jgi:hypothetical protein